MGRDMGGRFGREETWVYLWLILVDLWQKTTKFGKAIILQFKKNKVAKKENGQKYEKSFHWRGYRDANKHMRRHSTSLYVAAAAKSLQSCLSLCDPTDGSPLGSPVPGILQARTLEWGAIAFSSLSVREMQIKITVTCHCTPMKISEV